tara:strand:+ start:1533 stop:1748 length:216 start_codon:yes stop_codon:yes gene_type:complete
MEVNESTLLEITNIIWAQPNKTKKELPKSLKLEWQSKNWSHIQVSDWLSKYFNVKVDTLNIKELGNKASSG